MAAHTCGASTCHVSSSTGRVATGPGGLTYSTRKVTKISLTSFMKCTNLRLQHALLVGVIGPSHSRGAVSAHPCAPCPAASILRLQVPSRPPMCGSRRVRAPALSGLLILAGPDLHRPAASCIGGPGAATSGEPLAFAAKPTWATAPQKTRVSAHNFCISYRRNGGWLLSPALTRGSRAVATCASRGAQQPAVVVVESPTKAKKIQSFLGDKYKVLASYGHVRDLPSREGSVRPDEDFALDWQLVGAAEPRLAEIAGAASGAPLLLLATDPDREGEAISWHIQQELRRRGVLQRVGSVQRITFTEITRSAITAAMSGGRQVSQALVDAYLARRALDYLVGFHLSPVLWRKLPGAKSAGRVQSVALRLVCEREAAVEQFTATPYWSLAVELNPIRAPGSARRVGRRGAAAPPGESAAVAARLTHVDGRRLGPMDICSGQMADELARRIQSGPVTVLQVSSRQLQRHPAPPFITSSLQQEASRRLSFGAAKTMRIAQQLYEGAGTGEGLITYMRTDGVQMSAGAIQELLQTNEEMYGKDAVPMQPRQYKSRAKNAQEAHEAIRPTHPATITPSSLPSSLDADQRALYDLIWRRTVASQMVSAVYDVVTVEFSADGGSLTLRSSGSLLRQPGFLRAYADQSVTDAEEGEEEPHQQQQGGSSSSGGDEAQLVAAASQDNRGAAAEQLLTLQVGGVLLPVSVLPSQHWTRPPPRYTEASLVRALEERGIGRPSTYAPIMSLLQDRGYVVREGRSLLPTSLGRVLTAFLEHYFLKYVDYDFTSELEGQLDDVAGGKAAWRAVLSSFWTPFNSAVAAMSVIRTAQVYDMLDSALDSYLFRPVSVHSASRDGSGRISEVADASPFSSSPQLLPVPSAANVCSSSSSSHDVIDVQSTVVPPSAVTDPRLCPKCGRGRLVLKPSRFGGFIGCSLYADPEVACDFARPLLRAASAVDPTSAGSIAASDSEGGVEGSAEGSLSPGGVVTMMMTGANATERLLGRHPETGEPVWVRLGPYGLYVQLGDSVPKAPKAAKKVKRRGRKKEAAAQGQEDAADTEAGVEVEVEVEMPKPKRASIPKSKGLTLQSVTLPLALGLLSLPRSLGLHPGDGLPVIANAGPFGPYVAHNGLSVSLGQRASAQDVDLATAVQLLAGKRARHAAREAQGLSPPRGYRRAPPAPDKVKEAGTAGGTAVRGRAVGKAAAGRAAAKAIGQPSSRSQSGYTDFLQQRWQEIKAAEGPQVPYREAVSRVAAEWRALGEERRRRFEATAAATPESSAEPTKTAEKRLAARGAVHSRAATVAAATEAVSTPRPLNPYLRFCQQRRPDLRGAHPGVSLGEISKMLGAEWGALSAAQKEAYR